MMKNIFIVTHGVKLSKSGNYLVIKGKNFVRKIPIGVFSNLFILSNVVISSQVLKFLSKNGKYVFILNTAGKLKSIVLPELVTSSTSQRERQYLKMKNEEVKVYLSKELLIQKTRMAQNVLNKFRKNKGEGISLSIHNSFSRDILKLIDYCSTIEQLRGVDGVIMKSLYAEFSSSIREFFNFKRRSYHPPMDEANAMLSLIFSMFYSLLFPLVISYGLDPYVSFFHVRRGKHAALVSDLLELARPELIFFSADILNKGFFDASDFKRTSCGVYLRPKATKVLCKLFAEKLVFSDILAPIELFIKEKLIK